VITIHQRHRQTHRRTDGQTDRLHAIDLSGSRDVIGHVTIWFPVDLFLLVVYWNQASISNGFRDIQRQTDATLYSISATGPLCPLAMLKNHPLNITIKMTNIII